MKEEKIIVPANGYLMLFVFLILFFGGIFTMIALKYPWLLIAIVTATVIRVVCVTELFLLLQVLLLCRLYVIVVVDMCVARCRVIAIVLILDAVLVICIVDVAVVVLVMIFVHKERFIVLHVVLLYVLSLPLLLLL